VFPSLSLRAWKPADEGELAGGHVDLATGRI
jgi:hypothetical protein